MSETRVVPPIDVVCDASVVLKWFHAEGEQEVEASRRLLAAHGERVLALQVLDLTAYEVGNALIRGRGVPAADVTIVLDALARICPATKPTSEDLADAASLAEQHDLTLYDAAYAAVARRRGAGMATLDQALLAAGLGNRPSELSPG